MGPENPSKYVTFSLEGIKGVHLVHEGLKKKAI